MELPKRRHKHVLKTKRNSPRFTTKAVNNTNTKYTCAPWGNKSDNFNY